MILVLNMFFLYYEQYLQVVFFIFWLPHVYCYYLFILGMAAMRQTFGAALIIISIFIYINKCKHYIIYITFCLVGACLMHKSSIALIVMIAIFYKLNLQKKYLYLIIIASWITVSISNMYNEVLNLFVSLIAGSSVFEILTNRYSEADTIVNKTLLNMLPYNLFYLYLVYVSDIKSPNWKIFQIFIIGACIYNLLCSTQIGIRMTSIFYVIMLFSIPVFNYPNKKFVYLVLTVFIMYFGWRNIVMINSLKEIEDLFTVVPYLHYKLFFL